ncbi:MAG: bifunctional phosphoglucose/phosphomannose isomerase [Candidatus Thermoplasmatota archaeon]|jgi:glucose/mannose-6-phosphate isomerase|nr:bifunctional phosphoglucose/phosphomannose isomerase [Candidatus Thermoplasmatota archaeon]
MLDDLEQISKIDKSNMLDVIYKFPEQIKETIEIVSHTNIPIFIKIDNIIISGMGGSAISGDIVQQLFRDKLDVPIFVNREYDIPRWANKDTLMISQSYSGNTEETLSAFKQAYQKRCKIIGITSGGKLQEYCEKRGVPIIKIPAGFQPRAATSYILFSSLLAFKKIGLLNESIDSEIEETIQTIDELRKNINKSVSEKDNISKQIAKNIFNTIPQVYGWGIYSPIAVRWCTQFNENSKVIARYDIVSECNHNDIVGWSMNPEVSKKFSCILFRDEENESIYISKRLDFMRHLLEGSASKVIEVKAQGKKRLAKMMYTMVLGDFVSCYLAILRNIDPTPVDVIIELKKALAEI